MAGEILVRTVSARTVAVVRRVTTWEDLAETISEALAPVWAFLHARPELKSGQNVVMYLDEEVNIECGVEVSRPFASGPEALVTCQRTPAGRVLMTTHVGAYRDLPSVHEALKKHAAAAGWKLDWPCWEIYGDWSSDPEQLWTEVYYRLAN